MRPAMLAPPEQPLASSSKVKLSSAINATSATPLPKERGTIPVTPRPGKGPPLSEETVPVVLPLTEEEENQIKRIDMAYQLAQTYPDLVKPSYWKKRERQLKQLERRRRKREAEALAEAAAAQSDVMGITATPRIPLIRTMTVPSFEPVDDGDGGMDWNRSRQLAEEIRQDVARGRRPSVPALICTRMGPDTQSEEAD